MWMLKLGKHMKANRLRHELCVCVDLSYVQHVNNKNNNKTARTVGKINRAVIINKNGTSTCPLRSNNELRRRTHTNERTTDKYGGGPTSPPAMDDAACGTLPRALQRHSPEVSTCTSSRGHYF